MKISLQIADMVYWRVSQKKAGLYFQKALRVELIVNYRIYYLFRKSAILIKRLFMVF